MRLARLAASMPRVTALSGVEGWRWAGPERCVPGRRRCGETGGVVATSTRASGSLQPALLVLVPWHTDGMRAEDRPACLPLDTTWDGSPQ
jgi:hypothetical protein